VLPFRVFLPTVTAGGKTCFQSGSATRCYPDSSPSWIPLEKFRPVPYKNTADVIPNVLRKPPAD